MIIQVSALEPNETAIKRFWDSSFIAKKKAYMYQGGYRLPSTFDPISETAYALRYTSIDTAFSLHITRDWEGLRLCAFRERPFSGELSFFPGALSVLGYANFKNVRCILSNKEHRTSAYLVTSPATAAYALNLVREAKDKGRSAQLATLQFTGLLLNGDNDILVENALHYAPDLDPNAPIRVPIKEVTPVAATDLFMESALSA